MAERRIKVEEEVSIIEAVENLTSLAEIDLHLKDSRWLDPKMVGANRELVKEAFLVLHHYLHQLYEKHRDQLREKGVQKGIQAIMTVVGGAVIKIDKFTVLFKPGNVTEIPEYQDLLQFYGGAIVPRLSPDLEPVERWQPDWGSGAVDLEKPGIKDMEGVKRDQEYELFYLRREDGRPYFHRELFNHICLVGDFDETIRDASGDDPFSRAGIILDKDVQAAAKEMLQEAKPQIEEFYKVCMPFKDSEVVAGLNKALMALMLTANPRNLMQNTSAKTCWLYFIDFRDYLRGAMESHDYKRSLISISSGEHHLHVVMNLTHVLSAFLFQRGATHRDAIEWILRLIQKGGGKAEPLTETHTIWDRLQHDDGNIRRELKTYPNGPILKTVELFHSGGEMQGFDPIHQGNLPSQLYTFGTINCLRIPSPTKQGTVAQVEVIEEFRGLLRYLGSKMNFQSHLIINLQDRTSWREYPRCMALEELHKENENLSVVTLPKQGEFYSQSGPYESLNGAADFIKQFQEQIASGTECGYYFSSALNTTELVDFASKSMPLIHRYFFADANTFTQKNRLDFIEIFYQFFILKIIDMLKPTSISFTSKDAIDEGEAAAAEFYAFLHLMQNHRSFSQMEREFLLWMLYTPALTIRKRAIDKEVLLRALNALSVIQETQHSPLIEQMSALYSGSIFNEMKIQE